MLLLAFEGKELLAFVVTASVEIVYDTGVFIFGKFDDTSIYKIYSFYRWKKAWNVDNI